jgi:hypothetical protein
MKVRHAIFCTAFFCSTGTVHAQVCSGGAGGGMDATGNDCIDSASSLLEVIPVAGERKGIRLSALKVIPGFSEQIMGMQVPTDNVGIERLDALLVEQRKPAGPESETPAD